jgi:hypothetical protein
MNQVEFNEKLVALELERESHQKACPSFALLRKEAEDLVNGDVNMQYLVKKKTPVKSKPPVHPGGVTSHGVSTSTPTIAVIQNGVAPPRPATPPKSPTMKTTPPRTPPMRSTSPKGITAHVAMVKGMKRLDEEEEESSGTITDLSDESDEIDEEEPPLIDIDVPVASDDR